MVRYRVSQGEAADSKRLSDQRWLVADYFPYYARAHDGRRVLVLAVKHRLGLRPIADLPAKCACGAKLSDDSQHLYSCCQLKRKAMTVRHDSIVRFLRDSFHHVGAVVHVEPRLYDTKRVRPDLDILLPDVNMMLDVAVTHPGAPSRKSDRRFAAADDIQATKNRHYKDWALARGGRSSRSCTRHTARWADRLRLC